MRDLCVRLGALCICMLVCMRVCVFVCVYIRVWVCALACIIACECMRCACVRADVCGQQGSTLVINGLQEAALLHRDHNLRELVLLQLAGAVRVRLLPKKSPRTLREALRCGLGQCLSPPLVRRGFTECFGGTMRAGTHKTPNPNQPQSCPTCFPKRLPEDHGNQES